MNETPQPEGPQPDNAGGGSETPDPEIERFHDEGGPLPSEPEAQGETPTSDQPDQPAN